MELEELLVQEGVAAAREQIRAVLDEAARAGRHPAAALVEGGIVSEDVLAELLARATGTVVVELDDGMIVGDAPHLVSGAVARALLLLPIASTGGKLRVAFVNPLDREAISAVEEASGLPIQPMVATLTALKTAVEKAYEGRTTRVVRAPAPEMVSEITQQFGAPSEPAPRDTSPLHRIEQEATMEQRHEALLLALIERGALTRADYVDALKRLLSNRRS
jgi:hypothetical protein